MRCAWPECCTSAGHAALSCAALGEEGKEGEGRKVVG